MKKRLMVLAAIALVLSSLGPMVAAQGETLVIWADDTRAPIMTEIGAAFAEEYGVEVIVQEMGFGDIRDSVKVAGPAGEGPDIFIGAHDWLGELTINGLVAPIDLGDLEDQFLPAAVQAFVYEGELYGMPYAVENVAFAYNPEIVPEPPATWDEVKALSEEIHAADETKYGYIIQTNDPYHTFPLMTSFGGYVFGLTEEGYNPADIGLDSEGTLAAFTWLQSMVEDGLIPADINYDVMHTMFESGQAAMIVTGPWALPRIKDSGVPYVIGPIPGAVEEHGRPFLGVQGFMISAFSQNQLLAQLFLLDYAATEDVLQAIFEADPRPSAFLPVREQIEDPDIAGFAAAGENGLAMPAIPEMASVWSAWGNAQELVIRQQQTAEEAFTNAAAQIRELLAADLTGVVNVPGSWQTTAGCSSDWDPACEATALTDNGDGTFSGTFTIPAGEYEFKVALDGSWGENYGLEGVRDGDNIPLVLEADSTVTFVYDSATHLVEITIGE